MAVRTATYVGGRVFPFIHVAWLVSHPAQLSPNVTIVTIPNKVAACKLSLASPLWVCVCTQCVGLFHKRALASASVHSTVGWSACALLLFAAFSEPRPIHLTQQPSHAEPTETVTFGRYIYIYDYHIRISDIYRTYQLLQWEVGSSRFQTSLPSSWGRMYRELCSEILYHRNVLELRQPVQQCPMYCTYVVMWGVS